MTNKEKQELAAVLLAEYKAANDVVEEANKALEDAKSKRSDVVKKLNDQLGKGPFTYQGVLLGKIVIRPSKDGAKVTYFLRGGDDEKGFRVD